MRHGRSRASLLALPALLAALAATGCGSDPTGSTPARDSSTLYWSLRANDRAVTLALTAPYDTRQLAVTPLTYTGAPISGLPAASFRVLNPTVAGVTAQGVLTARAPGTTWVVTSLTAGQLTHQDTVTVTVTATAPAEPPGALEIIVPPVVSVGGYNLVFPTIFEARLTSATGTPIAGAAVAFETLDRTRLVLDRNSGEADPVRGGDVLVAASATAYGVTMYDTVTVRVTAPMLQIVESAVVRTADGRTARPFDPGSVTVVAGGSVSWMNGSFIESATDSMDIVFDDPSAAAEDTLLCFCGSGNIEPFITPFFGFYSTMRSFRRVGTYTYRSASTGQTGTVVVVAP